MFKQQRQKDEGASKHGFAMIWAPSSFSFSSSEWQTNAERKGGDWKAGAVSVIMGWLVRVFCYNELLRVLGTHIQIFLPHLSLPVFVHLLIRTSVFDNPHTCRSMSPPAHSCCGAFENMLFVTAQPHCNAYQLDQCGTTSRTPLLPSYWMFNLGDVWLRYLRAKWFHYVCLIRVY